MKTGRRAVRAFMLSGLGGLLACATIVSLFHFGCSQSGPSDTGRHLSLGVRVVFPDQAVTPSPGVTKAPAQPALDFIRAAAYEVLEGGEEVLRDQAGQEILPSDTRFELVLSVPPADLYRVQVEALAGGNVVLSGEGMVEGVEEDASREVTIQLEDPRIPAAPGQLAASAQSFSRIRLSWQDRADNETAYQIERRGPGENDFGLIHELSGSFQGEVAYADTGLVGRTPYAYRVRARGAAGFSPYAGPVDSRTLIEPPRNLAVTASSESSITLGWEFDAPDPDGFHLERRLPADDWAEVAQPDPAVRAFEDTGLGSDLQYRYRIRAREGTEHSPFSNEVLATTAANPPECSLSATTLAFGSVNEGSFGNRTFIITNTGGQPLDGTVSLPQPCPGFSLFEGGGEYSLNAGEQRSVTVRFEPPGGGDFECVIDAGAGCGSVIASGSGIPASACSLSATTLEFESVPVNTSQDLAFTITNTGGQTLAGTVSLPQPCPGFSLFEGGGDYSLNAGERHDVTVRFSPAAGGDFECIVDAGADCGSVIASGSGDPAPVCSLSTTTLEFGSVPVNTSRDLMFTITNIGGQQLEGEVYFPGTCEAFSIIEGAGNYQLGAGEEWPVTVRFRPPRGGDFECPFNAGPDCAPVIASGSGIQGPECQLSLSQVDFGLVPVNSVQDRSFTITNMGDQPLEGRVSRPDSCRQYSIPNGAGSYLLPPRGERTVTVRFEPPDDGTYTCSIDTGTDCNPVFFTGTGDPAPACSLSATAISFGTVPVDSSRQRSFTITNTGGQVLEGTVFLPKTCIGFSLVGGAGGYSLAAGEQHTVTVRFSPSASGTHTCAVQIGGGCSQVSLTGFGDPPPQCLVSTTGLDFGTVMQGMHADRSFSIRNMGGQLLTGTVSLPDTCDGYSLVSGEGDYSLAAGESHPVTVRFTAPGGGVYECKVDAGVQCGSVPAVGVGEASPVCFVSASNLSFGTLNVPYFQYADRIFFIRNDGGGTLSGVVNETCNHFSVIQGGGLYNLSAGQALQVKVRYQPTDYGSHSCTIQTGSACSTKVSVGGTGTYCAPTPTSLNFGFVNVSSSKTDTLRITNWYAGTVSGRIEKGTEADCSAFSIVFGGGDFILKAGESRLVMVSFSPKVTGTHTCTIETNSICPNIPVQGTGVDISAPGNERPGPGEH